MAVFTIQIDDKASGPAEQVASKIGAVVSALGAAGVGLDQVNLKMGSASSAANGLSGKFSEAITSTSALEGAASSLGAALNPVTLGIAVVAAAAAAAVAVIAGLTLALYDGAIAAIKFAEMRAGITASLEAMTGHGGEVVSMLDNLGQKLPFTTERMAAWSTKLAAAGITELPALQRGVTAAAAATALMRDASDGTAQKVTSLIDRYHGLGEMGAKVAVDKKLVRSLADIGLGIGDLAAQMGKTPEQLNGVKVSANELGDAIQNALIGKGKGALEQFGGESTQIWAKFKEGIGALFVDVAPAAERFMGQLRLLAAEFFQGGASAEVAKGPITALFTELFDVGTSALQAIHIGFLDLEIYALKAAIAVAPVVNAIRAVWSAADEGSNGGSTLMFFGLLADSVGMFGDALTGLPISGTVSSVIQIGDAAGSALNALGAAGAAVKTWGASSYSAASDFVSGLVNGITDGVGRVVTAAEHLGTSAVDAVKGVLGIHSPSVVMAGVGVNTAAGMAEGISQGQAGVERASRGLGGAAVGGATATTNSSTRGGDVTLNATLIIQNGGGADVRDLTEQGFGSMLERLAMQAGIIPAAVAT